MTTQSASSISTSPITTTTGTSGKLDSIYSSSHLFSFYQSNGKWLWIVNILLCISGPCAHCHLNPNSDDGPCKNSNTYPGICTNQAETSYCSTTSGSYNGPCRPTGNFEVTNEMSASNILCTLKIFTSYH